MRLIDADAIRIKPEYMHDICGVVMIRVEDVVRILNDMPTIKTEPNCSEFPNNWIPCTPENLPNEDEDVLVTVRYIERKSKKPKYYVDVARNYGGGWSSYSDEYKISPSRHKVIAWKEMPEPYEPKEGEQSETD